MVRVSTELEPTLGLQMLQLVRDKMAEGVAQDLPERGGYDWEGHWRSWTRRMFPSMFSAPFGPHHEEFWEWVWAIQPGEPVDEPFIGIWSRGGAKSSSAEAGTVALGTTGRRRYTLYVRSTQDMADKSVGNITALLEHPNVERFYPEHAKPALSKTGSSLGWRRNRVRTRGGFTVDALGLDVAARGVKVEDMRPDLIIFDDVDELHDSPHRTKKKIATLTKSILPAGTDITAVVGIQNLIIRHGIFSQLADDRAEFLMRRKVSGPHPAVRGLKTEMRELPNGRRLPVIISGEPTWEGQDREACQRLMDKIGLPSFLQECQHEVGKKEGALWSDTSIERVTKAPDMKRVGIAVDPSGGGDDIGIIAGGLGYDGRAYILVDGTQEGKLGPLNWGRKAVDLYDELEADFILGEKNFGGNLVQGNIRAAYPERNVPFRYVVASRGKALRAEPVASLYESGDVVHVGTFPELETEMTSWVPGDSWSPNRLDAMVHLVTELLLGGPKRRVRVHAVGGSKGNGKNGEAPRRRVVTGVTRG